MNVALSLNQINSQNIGLLESKTNIVMEQGKFTKINFLDDSFTMNGLYILFPISSYTVDCTNNRKNMKFQSNSLPNSSHAKDLIKLESRILDFYISNKQKEYKKSFLLKKQIESGFMKIYRENNSYLFQSHFVYILKISGIWESDGEIGITYKLFESNSISS
tara:strand:+ start:185 stop:670 length:486 start_codon:yes stop_codon:yes gene_type:complete